MRSHQDAGSSQQSNVFASGCYSGRVGSEAASVYDLAVFVESAVMAPDIPEVDPGRYPNLGTPASF